MFSSSPKLRASLERLLVSSASSTEEPAKQQAPRAKDAAAAMAGKLEESMLGPHTGHLEGAQGGQQRGAVSGATGLKTSQLGDNYRVMTSGDVLQEGRD